MIDPLMMKLASIFGSISSGGNFGNNSGMMDGPDQGGITGMLPRDNSSTFPNQGPMFPNVPNATGTDDMSQTIADLFRPNSDQFNKLAAMQPPNRADYEPNKKEKLSAFLASLGGNRPAGIANGAAIGFVNDPLQDRKIQESILDDRYNKALDDFETKLKPTEFTAELENRRNINDRMIGSQMLKDDQFQRRQTETERENKARDEDRRMRAEAYDYHQRNPDFKSATDDKGELVFYDPKDPTKVYYSGIQTGKLNDSDKINLQVQGRLSEIQAQAKSNKDLESQRQTGRETLEDKKETDRETLEGTKQDNRTTNESTRQANRVALKETVPGKNPTSATTAAAKPISETQKKQGLINKALQVISEHPEYKPYIVFEKSSGGTVQGVSVAKAGIFGNETTRMKAYNALYGEGPVPDYPNNKNVTPQTATKNQQGQTHVKRKADGKTGWVTNPDMSKYDLIP